MRLPSIALVPKQAPGTTTGARCRRSRPGPRAGLLVFGLVLALTSCIDVTIPADAGNEQPPSQPQGPGGVNPDPPGGEPGVPDASGGGLQQSDTGEPDAGAPQLPAACGSHCDCPPDYDCINERCVLGALPIQCCGHPLCPTGDRCWSVSGVEGVCGGP